MPTLLLAPLRSWLGRSTLAAGALVAACGGSTPAETTSGHGSWNEPPTTDSASSSGGSSTTMPQAGSGGDGGAGTIELPKYLALGDSVAFGYNINHKTYFDDGTSKELPDQAAHAIGYPEALVGMLARDGKVGLSVANTACPGEASGSLVTGKHVDDNDCWENRHAYALHYEYDHEDYDYRDGTEVNAENYGSGVSQLDHALAFLGDDPNRVKLVTITMGANDAAKFAGAECNWAQSLWDKACLVSGTIDAVLNKVQARWESALGALAETGYVGPIVVVLYYSPGYKLTDLPVAAGIKILNAKIRDAGAKVLAKHPALNLEFVDSYEVFKALASNHDDDPCQAGLTMLITDGPDAGKCDIHPSNLGEEQLAAEIWKSLTFEEQQALLQD